MGCVLVLLLSSSFFFFLLDLVRGLLPIGINFPTLMGSDTPGGWVFEVDVTRVYSP